MIHVDLQPEPAEFDTRVRQPGMVFLARHPSPTAEQWKLNRYWKECSDDLYYSYGGICAYTGIWFAKADKTVSVDHFLPKSHYQNKAYEWDNYRLTTQAMNSNKGDKDVVDPFNITNGDVVLDFPSCLVHARRDADAAYKSKIEYTIRVLKLNEEEEVNRRFDIIIDYISGNCTFQHLKNKYPFIAEEIERQGLITTLGKYFKPYRPAI